MNETADWLKMLSTPLGNFKYISLCVLQDNGYNISALPFSIRILLENILRNHNSLTFTREHMNHILSWKADPAHTEIPYLPARVLMQDFTGVPSIVDLASIRSEVARKNLNSKLINPQVPVDLIIDHSVQVDFFGTQYAYGRNVAMEYERNHERYALLKWAQASFENMIVLPPGMGICHQVNLEYLAKVVTLRDGFLFPDTLVGTDSHTPMINGIGVLGWGVGGIEAEAVMLGQPVYIMLPEVIGLKLKGQLKPGTTATDMVLTIAELLRKRGVVGKFVEVFGDGLNHLTVPDRATISNMSPEFGCTVTYFPPDDKTMEYLSSTGRDEKHIETTEQYLKSNLLWRENENLIKYTDVLELDLSTIISSLAGPKRPQDKISLPEVKNKFIDILKSQYKREYYFLNEKDNQWSNEGGHPEGYIPSKDQEHQSLEQTGIEITVKTEKKYGLKSVQIKTGNLEYPVRDGSVVIAAITSCTNTSNPSVMVGAGLLAKKAIEKGLASKPWVKTSLAPGSRVVSDYLAKGKLLPYLEALGFHVVGYGCTTCIGNSGPLPPHIGKAITENDLVVGAVLSGNRNFEARIHPQIKMNFLASPVLVVAYAIAGRIDINFDEEPIDYDRNFEPVYLKDIWPSWEEINDCIADVVKPENYIKNYKDIFRGDDKWKALSAVKSDVYQWDANSTYIKEAPFFKDLNPKSGKIEDIASARILLKLGDSVTTDHISPAGSIAENSPAGIYLKANGVEKAAFNSYGSRRGNHEVMIRGTFANIRLKNDLVEKEGGWTMHFPSDEIMSVYDASIKYMAAGTPLIVIAGKDYGSGSSRDWAAKGASLLGVRAIIAESFERIHRSNLVGMGILPLQFKPGEDAKYYNIQGDETIHIADMNSITPGKVMKVSLSNPNRSSFEINVIARLDSRIEVEYFVNGGILQYVLRNFMEQQTRNPHLKEKL